MIKILTKLLVFLFLTSTAWANQNPTAAQIYPNCSTWNKNLNCSMVNQQLVDNALDQLSAGGNVNWGDIGGLLSNQTDLQSALNAKQNTLSFGNLTVGTGLSITNGTGSLVGSNSAISIEAGYYLPTTADESNWNGKQAAGSYITGLTGDVTASGPGSVAATLATVNSNTGSFTNANITINGKGLITAASNGSTGGVTSVTATAPVFSSGGSTPNITLDWGSSLLLSGNNLGVNWSNLTTVNGTGINWQSFYPTSNPFSFLTSVPWSLGTILNMTGINWSSFYPTSNPFNYITSAGAPVQSVSNTDKSLIISPTTGSVIAGINWPDITTATATGINWQSFYPTSNPFNYLTANQTITLSGDTTGTGATSITTSTVRVNGLAIPASKTIVGTNSSSQFVDASSVTIANTTTGYAAGLTISGQTGILLFTGLTSNNRTLTIRDASDTVLELAGSYTPTGTWTSMALTTPTVATSLTLSYATPTTPAYFNSSRQLVSGTFTGNTTTFATTTGSFTNGNIRQSDGNSNATDSGISSNTINYTIASTIGGGI